MLLLTSCSYQDNTYSDHQYLNLNTGWQYRIGDSPVDSTGNLVWLHDSLNAEDWQPVSGPHELSQPGIKAMWLRVQIPEWKDKNPGIYFVGMGPECQIYLDQDLVYQFGNFISLNDDHFHGWRQHPIQLPDEISGRTLYIRLWSNGDRIGISPPILLASTMNIMKRLFVHNLDELLLSALFLILGLSILGLNLFLHGRQLLLGMSLFLLSMGVFTGSNALYLQYMFNAPFTFFILDLFSLLLGPVGAFMLTEQIIIPRYKPISRKFWQIELFYGIIIFIFVLLPVKLNLELIYNTFLILTASILMITMYLIIKSLKKGGKQVKILFYGLITAISAISIEILAYYIHKNSGIHNYNISWIHIGFLLFVASLFWIIAEQYIDAHKQKELARQDAMQATIQSERLQNAMSLNQLETEKWQELDRMKSQFFANISHEFRTPLTLIMGAARQIFDHPQDRENPQKLQMLLRNSDRLLHLVNQLLDISRLESGKMPLQAQPADLVPFVNNICQSFYALAKEKQQYLALHTTPSRIHLYFDKDKMEKIISNLLSNAIKFTPSGGHVDVTITENDQVEITVADTGTGILPQDLPHIFDRFYQSKQTPGIQYGSGIGLALTRELVKLHHGDLTVKSTPGQGSVFTVKLFKGRAHLSDSELDAGTTNITKNIWTKTTLPTPLIKLSHTLQVAAQQAENANAPLLLIVEDNDDMCQYISGILQNDFEIITAAEGQSGFAKAAEHVPDLVISDVMMPVMDGFDLCKQLKSDERTSHIPVILLTARSTSESKLEGLELGADDYLVKPFNAAELMTRSHNLIEQRRLLRQRFSNNINTSITEIAVTSADEQFLQRAINIIQNNIENENINIEWYSRQVGLSHSQLHRKLHALTGMSTSAFIRSVRLKRAVQLLEAKSGTIAEIAFATGFGTVDYFRKCFKKQFGVAPSNFTSQL